MHIGPLPPPTLFADYEAVHPGAAGWILDEATKNGDHVRQMELRAIKRDHLDTLLHRLLPFGVVVAFLVASVLIAILASPVIGGVGMFTTMGAVLIAYLTGRAPGSQPPEEQ
jgi:uncharacterized membrane protein